MLRTTMLLFSTSGRNIRARERTESLSCQSCAHFFVLVFACFYVSVAFAQQPFGTIVGTVTDQTGASLPAATVTVTNTRTRVNQTVVTSTTGDYSVSYLISGVYTIKAERPSFRPALMSNVLVRAAETVRVDFRMQLGEVQQVLQVSATATVLQTDTAVVGTTIDSKSVNELPLNGRTFAQLATLVPGGCTARIGQYRHRPETGFHRDILRFYGQWFF